VRRSAQGYGFPATERLSPPVLSCLQQFDLWIIRLCHRLDPLLYSRISLLGASIPAGSGCSAVCSSELSPSTFWGFILRRVDTASISSRSS
jgi:hypothetical protein